MDKVPVLENISMRWLVLFLKNMFGSIDIKLFKIILLFLVFYLSLSSATLGIRDIYDFYIDSQTFSFPVGIIFFPVTFVVSNYIQKNYDINIANTVLVLAIISDLLISLMLFSIADLGNSQAYKTVFLPLPTVWAISMGCIVISCLCNNVIFKYLRKKYKSGVKGVFISVFASSMSAEIILTSISMPLLFFGKHDVNTLTAIFLVLIYKFVVTFMLSILVVLSESYIDYKKQISVKS